LQTGDRRRLVASGRNRRRRGLARALLYEAFRRLRAYGAVETTVGTWSWNTATIALLESVGYRGSDALLAYARAF
jgi:ribosomal protein S18 acetylase RimI-like enzyme